MSPGPGRNDGAAAAVLAATIVALIASAGASLAQDLSVSGVMRYTENRGWNEAGLSPRYQIIVTATVVPSDHPTLAYVEQAGQRQPMVHFPQPSTPDLYAHWQDFDPALTAPWRIVAERAEMKSAPAWSAALRRPQKLPLVREVKVTGTGAEPRVRWKLPDLSGFEVDRVRVGVRGGKRLHGRFLSLLYVSGDLPANATTFRIPPGVLAAGERYVFQVMLEDLEGAQLENRSLTFSDPYTATAASSRRRKTGG